MKIAIVAAICATAVRGLRTTMEANPMRKILNMLEATKKTLEEEGRQEEADMKKFECWCDKESETAEKQIAEAQAAAEMAAAKAKESEGIATQLREELAQHKSDRADAQTTIKSATEQRQKEKNAFIEENGETLADIDAMKSAIGALEAGGGAFLQDAQAHPGMVEKIQNLLDDSLTISSDEKDTAISFLMGTMSEGDEEYAGSSGQVVGMLKQMLETSEAQVKEAQAAEDAAEKDFKELTAAKEQEIAAATTAIEEKTERLGNMNVEAVQAKNDAENAGDEGAANAAQLQEMKEMCGSKSAEAEERTKMRAEEMSAIADAIGILGNDDALETFRDNIPKKEAAAESFLQRSSTHKQVARQALEFLHKAQKVDKNPKSSLALIASMIKIKSANKAGTKVDFSKVLKMIDDMVVVLKQESDADTKQKETCETDIANSEASKKEAQDATAQFESKVEELSTSISNQKESIAALKQEIEDAKSASAELTAEREQQNKDFQVYKNEQKAVVDLLAKAINRLKKFYQPKPAEAKEPAAEPEPAFVQLRQVNKHQTSSSAAPPTTFEGDYKKKNQNGVITILEKFSHEAELGVKAAETQEQNDQSAYEDMMAKSKESTEAKEAAVSDQTGALADLETQKTGFEGELATKQTELLETGEHIANLHSECDFLLEYYDLRMEARETEAENLKNAKAVLSGADFS